MSKYLSFMVGAVCWAVWTTAQAAPWEPGLVARIHFAGGNAVAADPNARSLAHVWSSPEALALRMQTLDKLSRFLDVWLHQQIAPNLATPIQTRPLLADLCDSEWQLDVHQPVGEAVEFSLAVRLDNARAQAWLNTFAPVVAAWKRTSPTHQGQVVRSGQWLFLQLGNSPVVTTAGAITPLRNAWLTADVDWTRLAVWYPAWREFDLPQTRLQVTGRNGEFDVTGKLYLAQPLPPLEKWQFPVDSIHSPLVSFTAARGISDWLSQQPWAVSLGINPLPSQIFTWVKPPIPFAAYAAMPLPNAPAALPKLDQALTAALHGNPNSPFRHFTISLTNNQISLIGLPLIVPHLKAVRESNGEYLQAGFFPDIPRGRPLPPEITGRLNDPGLVFYHWEDTGERLKIFPELYQLILVLSRHRQLDVKSAAGNWLVQLRPSLGASVTEATETSPTELAFSRQAPAGLTAVELVALCSWLEAPDFPGCDLRMPPPRFFPRRPLAHHGPLPFMLHH